MGCGESKHAVATGNTISKSESKKGIEAIPEKVTNGANPKNAEEEDVSSVQEQGEEEGKDDSSKVVQQGGDEKLEDSPAGGNGEAVTETKNEIAANGEVLEDQKSNIAEEEKGSVEETIIETKNGTGEPVEVKESEVVPTVEPEATAAASATGTEQEKTVNADEEIVTDSSAEDPKTN